MNRKLAYSQYHFIIKFDFANGRSCQSFKRIAFASIIQMYSNRIEATYSRFYYNDVVFMIISYKTTVNAEVPNYYAINYQKNMTHFVGCDAFFFLTL